MILIELNLFQLQVKDKVKQYAREGINIYCNCFSHYKKGVYILRFF